MPRQRLLSGLYPPISAPEVSAFRGFHLPLPRVLMRPARRGYHPGAVPWVYRDLAPEAVPDASGAVLLV